MPTVSRAPLSGRYLSFAEREEIAILRAQEVGVRETARQLGRSPRPFPGSCAATPRPVAGAWSIGPRPPSGTPIGVPSARRSPGSPRTSGSGTTCSSGWPARSRGPTAWLWGARRSGGSVAGTGVARIAAGALVESGADANRLGVDFPHDGSMRISHEAIYQALYVQGRGALRRELTACLRTGRALRVPRARTQGRGQKFVSPEIMISQRPAEVADRAVPGHWEGDLILGLGSSAVGTLVERTSRFTMLLHLPRMDGHGDQPRAHNGPALAGHGAEAVRDAIAASISTLPDQLRRSLTWDQGAEMAQHARLRIETGLAIYVCDPHSPWQRGTNENTNGLLRQYFPKGTDLSRHTPADLDAVAAALNSRPRKTLGWKTPAEALNEQLLSIQRGGVATTP